MSENSGGLNSFDDVPSFEVETSTRIEQLLGNIFSSNHSTNEYGNDSDERWAKWIDSATGQTLVLCEKTYDQNNRSKATLRISTKNSDSVACMYIYDRQDRSVILGVADDNNGFSISDPSALHAWEMIDRLESSPIVQLKEAALDQATIDIRFMHLVMKTISSNKPIEEALRTTDGHTSQFSKVFPLVCKALAIEGLPKSVIQENKDNHIFWGVIFEVWRREQASGIIDS